MKNIMKQFVKDRNKVLMNLENNNVDEIMKYCEKYNIPIPLDNKTILAGLHKARLYVTSPEITNEMKQRSADWLIDNGFTLDVFGSDDNE